MGRQVESGGRVLDLPVMIDPRAEKRYSPRCLSEDERIRLAALRRQKQSIRAIVSLMDRSPSTISRELQRGSVIQPVGTALTRHTGGYSPVVVCVRPSQLCHHDELREWVATKLKLGQGKGMAGHPEIASALLRTGVCFCDPHSPWQRPAGVER